MPCFKCTHTEVVPSVTAKLPHTMQRLLCQRQSQVEDIRHTLCDLSRRQRWNRVVMIPEHRKMSDRCRHEPHSRCELSGHDDSPSFSSSSPPMTTVDVTDSEGSVSMDLAAVIFSSLHPRLSPRRSCSSCPFPHSGGDKFRGCRVDVVTIEKSRALGTRAAGRRGATEPGFESPTDRGSKAFLGS